MCLLSSDRLVPEPFFEPLQSLGDAHTGLVAQVAAGGVDAEPVSRRELAGEEARHGWLVAATGEAIEGFQQARGGQGERAGDRSPDGTHTRGLEEVIDHVPERDRL